MKRFTCVSIGFGRSPKTEREAENTDTAADACAKAVHTAYWANTHRDGTDCHGAYTEYAIHATASRLHGTVRIYEQYKP